MIIFVFLISFLLGLYLGSRRTKKRITGQVIDLTERLSKLKDNKL